MDKHSSQKKKEEKCQFTISFYQYLKSCLGVFNKVTDREIFYYKRCETLILELLDVGSLMQKQIDLEILKRMVLDPDQLQIYQQLSKPKIYEERARFNSLNIKISRGMTYKIEDEEKEKILHKYCSKFSSKQKKMTVVDRFLLSELNVDMKKFIEEEREKQ